MERVAPDVWLIRLGPRYSLNAYLIGDVLVDAGLRIHAPGIIKRLSAARMTVAKHVVTHAHIDHVGGMRQIAATTGAPIQIGAAERDAAQTGQSPCAAKLERPGIRRIARRLSSFEPFPIERTLVEGDDIGFGFTVIDTPGHAPGHISLWRPQDRTLLAGDVIAGMSPLTGRRATLDAPPNVFSINADLHLVSARRLAALEPDTVCFGQGPPLRLGTRSLRQFVDQL